MTTSILAYLVYVHNALHLVVYALFASAGPIFLTIVYLAARPVYR